MMRAPVLWKGAKSGSDCNSPLESKPMPRKVPSVYLSRIGSRITDRGAQFRPSLELNSRPEESLTTNMPPPNATDIRSFVVKGEIESMWCCYSKPECSDLSDRDIAAFAVTYVVDRDRRNERLQVVVPVVERKISPPTATKPLCRRQPRRG